MSNVKYVKAKSSDNSKTTNSQLLKMSSRRATILQAVFLWLVAIVLFCSSFFALTQADAAFKNTETLASLPAGDVEVVKKDVGPNVTTDSGKHVVLKVVTVESWGFSNKSAWWNEGIEKDLSTVSKYDKEVFYKNDSLLIKQTTLKDVAGTAPTFVLIGLFVVYLIIGIYKKWLKRAVLLIPTVLSILGTLTYTLFFITPLL
jgi:hypothetical protein